MSVLFTRRGAPPVTYDPVFANNTWEQIIEACQSGKVPDTWNVADQKVMTINGTDYLIDIIGKGHDTYSDGTGAAPLTFQLHNVYQQSYAMGSSYWDTCPMRKTHLPAIMALMPAEVQSGIREVSKLSSAGAASSTIISTPEKLFLLSTFEVFGHIQGAASGEGAQYAYYKQGNSKIKYYIGSTSGDAWWTRSSFSSTNCCLVQSDGTGATSMHYSYKYAIAPAFCF